MPNDGPNQRRDRRPGFDFGGGGSQGGSGGPQADRNRRVRMTVWIILAVLAAFLLFRNIATGSTRTIDYSAFKNKVRQGPTVVTDVTVSDSQVSGTFITKDGKKVHFVSTRAPGDDITLFQL